MLNKKNILWLFLTIVIVIGFFASFYPMVKTTIFSKSPTANKNIQVNNNSTVKLENIPSQPLIHQSNKVSNKLNKPKNVTIEKQLFALKFGSDNNSVGFRGGEESNLEGPASLIYRENGNAAEIWILDQINKKIKIFDSAGKNIASLPLPTDTAQDFAIADNGVIFILDRYNKAGITSIDNNKTKFVEFNPAQIPHPGLITGLFLQKNKVLIELEHEKIWILDQKSNKYTATYGRPLKNDDNKQISAKINQYYPGIIVLKMVDSQNNLLWSKDIFIDDSIINIVFLESSEQGDVFIGFESLLEQKVTLNLVKIAASNLEMEMQSIPTPWATAIETFRPVSISNSGSIVMMIPFADGIKVVKYDGFANTY